MSERPDGGHFSDLDVTVPAEARYLRELRHLVRLFGRAAGADNDVVTNMLLAVNEACANVVIHAYDEGGGPLHVRAWQSEDGLTLEVSDNGTPVAKPVEGRIGGRGLDVIRTLSDDLDVEGPGEYGTRLQMDFKLRR
jgi:anti-sigma regulatory factor (Ser/Thr protein kinase)